MDGTFLDNYRLLAHYNRWFNGRLYDACERLSDEDRKRDRGAFFGKGVRREHPAWMALTHFFNNQTHHRGQITALLMQAGIDPSMTDLIALAPQAPQ